MHREITSDDQQVIDNINRLTFAAWRMWREYFHRSPEDAAALMIQIIKDHEAKDRGLISKTAANENPALYN